ncbi:hypothetical protein AXK58_21520 [Tsukamurella tyrosinosolvens]|nr:hypothetical protein AXK58_21520 [Tsukamurella tyrosinosolvens]
MAHYLHQAAVLTASDNLIVARRPDPLEREDEEIADSWDREGGYSVTVWDQHPGEVQMAYNFEPSEPLTPREAAALGLSLVAAARRAVPVLVGRPVGSCS